MLKFHVSQQVTMRLLYQKQKVFNRKHRNFHFIWKTGIFLEAVLGNGRNFYKYEDKILTKECENNSYDDSLCRGTLDSLKLHNSFLYFPVSTEDSLGASQVLTTPSLPLKRWKIALDPSKHK